MLKLQMLNTETKVKNFGFVHFYALNAKAKKEL